MSADNPTSPEYRSRAPEFYGFVAWTSTTICFILFLFWALLPDDITIWVGRMGPAPPVVLVLLTHCVYFSLAIARPPAFSEINAFIDPNTISELHDIPIGIVNRVIYGPHCRRMGDIPTREK
ncbi:hypothetical protein BJ138DRAFT_1175363 [Hygrophoropsis aurantiaca]|uniref:Uncharacterized protein n=1 Tax=Hygrophoropsis aurantiaca TaxID=72124 RepID=A0ACB7ZTC4_9AGAM|nr:hypothetical protein BJ138DRAFT_1175363 [Hygrophoropsis aurantiaca]